MFCIDRKLDHTESLINQIKACYNDNRPKDFAKAKMLETDLVRVDSEINGMKHLLMDFLSQGECIDNTR